MLWEMIYLMTLRYTEFRGSMRFADASKYALHDKSSLYELSRFACDVTPFQFDLIGASMKIMNKERIKLPRKYILSRLSCLLLRSVYAVQPDLAANASLQGYPQRVALDEGWFPEVVKHISPTRWKKYVSSSSTWHSCLSHVMIIRALRYRTWHQRFSTSCLTELFPELIFDNSAVWCNRLNTYVQASLEHELFPASEIFNWSVKSLYKQGLG